MRRILIAICGAALGAVLLAPTSASAAVTCTQVTDTVTIAVDAASPQVSIDRSGSQIRAFAGAIGGGPDQCAADAPTVTDTDTVVVNDIAGHALLTLISLQGGTFTPGENVAPPTVEVTGPELEITVNAGDGADRLELDGSDNADDLDLGQVAAGTFAANTNAASDGASPDCDDVTAAGIESVVVRGRGGDDDVNATSCNGIGGAVPLDPDSLTIEGGNNADILRGGPGADGVKGGTQDDNVNGGAGDDSVDGERDQDKVEGGTGADMIEGGTETDRVFYDDRATTVTATMGNGGADDGGSEDQSGGGRDNIGLSVENFTAGTASDNVAGSSVANRIEGGSGDDVLGGGEGDDEIEGGLGNDTIDGAGGADEVLGQDGSDTGRGSGGKDRLLGGNQGDKLFGGPKSDFLRGDKGKDAMSGQAGNDRINAKDKKVDKKIHCGKGKAKKESATVDKSDPKAKSC